jgi:pimeloyl-ACP methyl ester carboxylesterase
LLSISRARQAIDLSTLPPVEHFQGRDGTWLGFRHYAAVGAPTDRGAIVIHGSAGSSGGTIHALSRALAVHGVETWAVDIRGHGTSGTRGDIGYLGQLEDDLADLVAMVRKTAPDLPITLIGHSAGGGFALRVAGSPIQGLFARTVLLAPYLGYDAPTNRPHSGGWASPDIPRYLALSVLRSAGLTCCEGLPTLAYAVPPGSEAILTPTYSYRLMRNFGSRDYKADLAVATRPLTVFVGREDELMLAEKYPDAVHAIAPKAEVRLIDGVDHIGIVSAPDAIAAIAADVALHPAGPS